MKQVRFQDALAISTLVICLAYLFMYHPNSDVGRLTTPEQINAAIQFATNDMQIRTFAIGLVMIIGNFYFGSSKGSQKKDETIASMQDNAPTANITTDKITTDKIELT